MLLMAYASSTFALGGARAGGFSSGSRSFSSSSARVSSSSIGKSSSRSSSSSSTSFSRSSALSSLSGKGAKGDAAGILFKSSKIPTPTLSSKSSTNDITTAFDPAVKQHRRSSYYDGYRPTYSPGYATVIQNHSSGYGIWDLMLFNSIMDNVGDRAMYYHHQSDPAFKQWRSDADQACINGDKDVCEKLRDLDKEMADYKQKGVKPNEQYMTPGIDPDIYESSKVEINDLKTLKVCTGSLASDYARFSEELFGLLKKSIKNDVKMESVATPGSADNLNKMLTGECDLSFSQKDIVNNPNLVSILTLKKQEVTTFICGNSSGVQNLSDVKSDTKVYIGHDQTGSLFTYKVLATKSKLPTPDLSKSSLQIANDLKPNECFFGVSTTEVPYLKTFNNKKLYSLIAINSKNLDLPQYTTGKIKQGVYDDMTQSRYKSFFGNMFSDHGTDVIEVPTALVAPLSWTHQHQQLFDLLMLESSKLQVSLR